MSEVTKQPVFTLDEALDANQITFREVEAHGGTYRLCSLNTDEILEWLGEKEDKTKRVSGLRLAVRSICDAEGNRYIGPDGRANERYEAAVRKFQSKDAAGNKLLIAAAMELNGMTDIAKALVAAKNV